MENNVSKIILVISAIVILLLASACKRIESPPENPSPSPATTPSPSPEPPPPLPPEVILEVQTNFDILTPFIPQHTLHTRLHPGALPEFIPSDNYGKLLPYSSAAILEDGSLHTSKYGLVTIDGIIVTDLIYDDIDRAEYIHGWYTGTTGDIIPAYKLSMNIPDGINSTNRKLAACAMDGSWITPFDYTDIIFTKDVILLYREEHTLNIDVRNYEGKHLYNMKDMRWAGNALGNTWTGVQMEIIADRYAHVRTGSSSFAFINLLTGSAQSTRFIAADPFIEGIAPVGVGIRNTYYVIWGLINTDFNVIIQPRYYSLPFFRYGKAIVQRRDDSQFVINTKGEVLYNVREGYRLSQSYEGPNFILFNEYGADPDPRFLTSDFREITPIEGTFTIDFFYPRYLGNRWYTTGNEFGTHLIRETDVHFFPGIDFIDFTDGELIIYGINYADDHGYGQKQGVMTLNGEDIIPAESGIEITSVTQNGTTTAFIISTGSSLLSTGHGYDPNTFKLVAMSGGIILQGQGILTYHDYLELFSIQNANHFSWLDKDAKTIISIPLLSSTFD